jgi:EAL domain-containing protein (putative c-di-GMP-specific phosphodiesterase class I)
MSVNLFPSQIRCADLAAEVAELLHRYDIDPGSLELEITETATLQDGDQSFKVISDLRELGVGIAFDDFGTGYASLGTLQRYPITTLKIDRGFVRDLLTKQRDAAITRALIMLSRDIGVTTIAEGIETAEQELTLKMMGCDCGQGYLYGRSMPPSEIAEQLARLSRHGTRSVARAG